MGAAMNQPQVIVKRGGCLSGCLPGMAAGATAGGCIGCSILAIAAILLLGLVLWVVLNLLGGLAIFAL